MQQMKIKKYEKVMKVLATLQNYTKTEELCELVGMDKKNFSLCVSKARLELAKQGIIIVNKHGKGYKVGTPKELVVEGDKSCKRALSQVMAMKKILNALKESRKRDDLDEIPENIINDNIEAIAVVFDKPIYDDFDSYEEFDNAVSDYVEKSRTTSSYIESIPNEFAD